MKYLCHLLAQDWTSQCHLRSIVTQDGVVVLPRDRMCIRLFLHKGCTLRSDYRISRFVSRRGCPLHRHSDKGTTFVGASRIITKEFIQTSHKAVISNYTHQNFTYSSSRNVLRNQQNSKQEHHYLTKPSPKQLKDLNQIAFLLHSALYFIKILSCCCRLYWWKLNRMVPNILPDVSWIPLLA